MPTLVDYKKAHFNYEILEKYEAGIELVGHEVKALKSGKGSLEGAYVIVRGGEAYVVGMLISPYQEKNTPKDYEPRRNRRLILTKKEIAELASNDGGNSKTLIPISIFTKGNLVKISIAIVKGKKQFDKRASIKEREVNRTVRREFSDR
jgi:SsrA-binding protein